MTDIAGTARSRKGGFSQCFDDVERKLDAFKSRAFDKLRAAWRLGSDDSSGDDGEAPAAQHERMRDERTLSGAPKDPRCASGEHGHASKDTQARNNGGQGSELEGQQGRGTQGRLASLGGQPPPTSGSLHSCSGC